MRKMKKNEEVIVVDQDVAKVTKAEVRRVYKRMKSEKAVDPDDMLVEVWKCLGEFLTGHSTRS